ncbi:MAG: hypothetical protein H6R01_73 [Burkholderiaceae bacterium]|nr:hypothetical protein [Burkholderiaceae bacterium]
MGTISRLMRHLLTTSSAGKRAFPPATLRAIEAAIAEGEARHRAEVSFIVEHSLPLHELLHRTGTRQRALDLFARYRVWDTEENCGVLLYLNLADRKLEIVADRGVAGQIGNDDWNAVCQTMTQGFAQDEFHHSSLAALAQLNALLALHYPADGERVNQLSDKPILL